MVVCLIAGILRNALSKCTLLSANTIKNFDCLVHFFSSFHFFFFLCQRAQRECLSFNRHPMAQLFILSSCILFYEPTDCTVPSKQKFRQSRIREFLWTGEQTFDLLIISWRRHMYYWVRAGWRETIHRSNRILIVSIVWCSELFQFDSCAHWWCIDGTLSTEDLAIAISRVSLNETSMFTDH